MSAVSTAKPLSASDSMAVPRRMPLTPSTLKPTIAAACEAVTRGSTARARSSSSRGRSAAPFRSLTITPTP